MHLAKFRVGEEVIIQSINYPEVNGQVRRIIGVLTTEEESARSWLMAKEQGVISIGFNPASMVGRAPHFYILVGLTLRIKKVDGAYSGFTSDTFNEAALRRFHRIATLSYHQLMASLGSRVTA